MHTQFDTKLELLNAELISMGALCEAAIRQTAEALMAGDVDAATKISALEAQIDAKEDEIQSLTLSLLLHHQPVARDLRTVSTALKMITDLERIGDQAEDIAEIIIELGGTKIHKSELIAQMAQDTCDMVTSSVEAFVRHDITQAQEVIAHDDIVDKLFEDVKLELIRLIDGRGSDGEYAVELLLLAKYFERIGDHATNVAEWVEFSITGEHRSDDEC